jgi:hypothetical protein
MTYDLIGASGSDGGPDDDFYVPVVLAMPNDAGTYKWFVQFTRGRDELRSSIIALDVVADQSVHEVPIAQGVADIVVTG